MADLEEEQPPQLEAEEINQIRQLLVARLGCTEEEAANRLQTLLVPAERGQQGDPPPPPASPSPSPPPRQTPPPEDESSFLPKKKIVFADFELDVAISEWIPHSPDPHAVARIKAMEYVELWYFTPNGIKDASQRIPTAVEDAFGLLRTEAGLAFQPIKASRAAHKVDQDELLSWEMILTARHNLLREAFNAGWPEKIRKALTEFYVNLEELGAQGKNPKALVLYHAVVRRRWHAALKGAGRSFNISIINSALFAELENQLRDKENEDMRRQMAALIQKETSFSVYNGRDRGRNQTRDRGPGRQRSSRSRSPIDNSPKSHFRTEGRRREPPPLSACQICLGRQKHAVHKCRASLLWNGKHKAPCTRGEDGRITNEVGQVLCSDWNKPIGCKDGSPRHVHQCSGCGDTSHGAQECPRAEKASSTNAARR